MSLSAERVAIANQAIRQTFVRSSVAWQAVPHWLTGDPGQVLVRTTIVARIDGLGAKPAKHPDSDPLKTDTQEFTPKHERFSITLAQATAPVPDELLAAVIPRTVRLAGAVDKAVLDALKKPAVTATKPAAGEPTWYPELNFGKKPEEILPELVRGRSLLEDSGYRAPTCLVISTNRLADFNKWAGSYLARDGLLSAADANALHRSSHLNGEAGKPDTDFMLMLGRSQEMAPGRAADASPGEEPVDLAISVPPELEVIGETDNGKIDLAVRIRFAVRIKDERGVVVFHN